MESAPAARDGEVIDIRAVEQLADAGNWRLTLSHELAPKPGSQWTLAGAVGGDEAGRWHCWDAPAGVGAGGGSRVAVMLSPMALLQLFNALSKRISCSG